MTAHGTVDATLPGLGEQYSAPFTCVCLTVALLISYAVLVKPLVTLPADILMWEETNFVGDNIKLLIGSPVYATPSGNNSLISAPLAPMLTYGLSLLFNLSTSIVGWRVIQLGFVVCAALIATRCGQSFRRLADPGHRADHPWTWSAFVFGAPLLTATSPEKPVVGPKTKQ